MIIKITINNIMFRKQYEHVFESKLEGRFKGCSARV